MLDILREEWGYEGMVVSDCWGINDFYLTDNHGTHSTPESAAADAVNHTTDLECGSVYENLVLAVEQGLVTEEQIDQSLRRILRGWFELGMLDPVEKVFFFSSRRRHTSCGRDWSSDVCSSDLPAIAEAVEHTLAAIETWLRDGIDAAMNAFNTTNNSTTGDTSNKSSRPTSTSHNKTNRSEERRVGKERRSR